MTREEEIQARLEAATPGPWRYNDKTDHGSPLIVHANRCVQAKNLDSYREGFDLGDPLPIVAFHQGDYDSEAWFICEDKDGELIAHAPEDIAYLLEENARLRALLVERCPACGSDDVMVGEQDAVCKNCGSGFIATSVVREEVKRLRELLVDGSDADYGKAWMIVCHDGAMWEHSLYAESEIAEVLESIEDEIGTEAFAESKVRAVCVRLTAKKEASGE